jgi:hypothetical protein
MTRGSFFQHLTDYCIFRTRWIANSRFGLFSLHINYYRVLSSDS